MTKSQPYVLAYYPPEALAKARELNAALDKLAHSQYKVSELEDLALQLETDLKDVSDNQKVIILTDISSLEWTTDFPNAIQVPEPQHIRMGASALFGFQNESLKYFYWKHYPRNHSWYNYPDSSVMWGRGGDFNKLFKNFDLMYPGEVSLQNRMVRYYADQVQQLPEGSIRIQLDHEQRAVASTVLSSRKKLISSWLYGFLYMRNEGEASGNLLNIRQEGNRYHHELTGTNPVLISTQVKSDAKPRRPAWLYTFKDWLYIGRVNKWHYDTKKIFRYLPNKSRVLDEGTQAIVSRLETSQPLSFAHYNDGELTFIKDFLKGETHEKWFGRKQQKYDPLLAERLKEAMTFKKEGYFVGVPCSTDHPALRRLADELVGTYAHKVQAMSIHHNLAYMPRILAALRNRQCYFFTNEYQDVSFFSDLGIEVKPQRVTQVPFKNSYLEFDKYKDMKFPKDAVVVLTCGMLAKILTKVWYQNHEHLSILALGSSLDDHIQKQNINFELYPSETPLTRNIKYSRSFLFGYKKLCKECYDF